MLYQQLKYRHLSSYAPFCWSLINRLLDIPLLEDRRPSVLIYSMLSLLPQGEPAGSLFLSLFLRRRPLDMRDQMSTRQTADLLWDTCGHPHVTASGTALALLMSTNLAAFSPAAYLRRPSSPYPHRRWSPSRWSRTRLSATITAGLGWLHETASCPAAGRASRPVAAILSPSPGFLPAASRLRLHDTQWDDLSVLLGLVPTPHLLFRPVGSMFDFSKFIYIYIYFFCCGFF